MYICIVILLILINHLKLLIGSRDVIVAVSSNELDVLRNLKVSVDEQLCSTTENVNITEYSPLVAIHCNDATSGSVVRIEPIPGAHIPTPIHLRLSEIQIYRGMY